MKKLLILLSVFLTSCAEPILRNDEYTIIDTVNISKNGFGQILGYDVIILSHYDSSYHLGGINTDNQLCSMSVRPIKFK
jgi:hypothetical protein